MPELWLGKANTNLPGNKYRVCVSEKEIKKLSESSTYIFKTTMLDQ